MIAPEAKARQLIDVQLAAAGWVIQDRHFLAQGCWRHRPRQPAANGRDSSGDREQLGACVGEVQKRGGEISAATRESSWPKRIHVDDVTASANQRCDIHPITSSTHGRRFRAPPGAVRLALRARQRAALRPVRVSGEDRPIRRAAVAEQCGGFRSSGANTRRRYVHAIDDRLIDRGVSLKARLVTQRLLGNDDERGQPDPP